MADQLLAQVQDAFEGQIDFEGQKKTEYISTILLVISGVISLIAGLVQQDIHLTLLVGLAGTLVTFLVVVPPWPFYNQNPQPWLAGKKSLDKTGIVVDGRKIR